MKFHMIAAVAILVTLNSTASAQVETKRGAVVGGLSGAAIGAIIGENNDEAGAGAAIGGLIGAVAGGALGSANDQQQYPYRAQGQPRYFPQQGYPQPGVRYPQGAIPAPAPLTISTSDVVTMAQSRVSDSVIISEIQSKGIARPLEVRDIVYLSQQGVSDAVIRTMQSAGSSQPVAVARTIPPPRSPAVIVERYPHPVVHHYPYPRRPPVHYHYRTGRRPQSGVSVSFGHGF